MAKHVHQKMTEGDVQPCVQLNSVQRTLTARCAGFVPGRTKAAGIEVAGFGECPRSAAAREARFRPVLTRHHACPDFQHATPRPRP